MSDDTLNIISMNHSYILGNILSWVLTGISISSIVDFTHALLSIFAVVLSCCVSLYTIYKIRKELEKKDGKPE